MTTARLHRLSDIWPTKESANIPYDAVFTVQADDLVLKSDIYVARSIGNNVPKISYMSGPDIRRLRTMRHVVRVIVHANFAAASGDVTILTSKS